MKPIMWLMPGILLILACDRDSVPKQQGVSQELSESQPNPERIWVKLEDRNKWNLPVDKELLVQLYAADTNAQGVPSISKAKNYVVERPCNPSGGVYAAFMLSPTASGMYVLAISKSDTVNPRIEKRSLIGYYVPPGSTGPLPTTPTKPSIIHNAGQYTITNPLKVCAGGGCQ